MKFNRILKRLTSGDTINYASGRAFTQSPRDELVSILLTATLSDQFYRSGDATTLRVRELVAGCQGKMFVAKAAIYARTKAGMRSVSHLVAAEIAHSVKGAPWTKRFTIAWFTGRMTSSKSSPVISRSTAARSRTP